MTERYEGTAWRIMRGLVDPSPSTLQAEERASVEGMTKDRTEYGNIIREHLATRLDGDGFGEEAQAIRGLPNESVEWFMQFGEAISNWDEDTDTMIPERFIAVPATFDEDSTGFGALSEIRERTAQLWWDKAKDSDDPKLMKLFAEAGVDTAAPPVESQS